MQDQDLAAGTMRRVYWRVVPLLFAAMLCNYLDRVNVGFAALRMNHDLGFTPGMFGFGASIFFAGYALLGVPSNLMLNRLGARFWLPGILIFWGAVATGTAFVHGAGSFYAARFLLGMAEAGAMPGFALYVTQWFPPAYRARAIAGYIIAGQVSGVFGGPLNATLLHGFDHVAGLHGWQWLFILEGGPTILVGLAFLALLPGRVETARWLAPAQRAWLQAELATEQAGLALGRALRWSDILLDLRLYWLAALFGFALVGIYGLMIWLPQIVDAMGRRSLMQVGVLSVVPLLLGVVGQLLIGTSSDRSGDRKFHLGGAYLLAAVCIAASAAVGNKELAFLLLCVAGFGLFGGNPLFWSLASSMLGGRGGAIAIAFINSLAQFGGLLGPWMLGAVKGATGSFTDALYVIALCLAVAGVLALFLRTAPPGAAGGRRGATPASPPASPKPRPGQISCASV